MAKIGFIGMGNIGYAIMRSLLNKYKTEDITFTDLNRRRVAQIEKETGVKAVDTNQDCAENAKYIVLAIKPQFYDNVLADIKDHVTKENIIISIAPGITIDSVNEKLGGDRRIVRAMPNTPALIGEGMTGVCYDKKLFEETEKQMISNFFESFGMMEIVPEYMMNAVVCISSSTEGHESAVSTHYGDELMNLGLITSDASSGQYMDGRRESCDFDSRLFYVQKQAE